MAGILYSYVATFNYDANATAGLLTFHHTRFLDVLTVPNLEVRRHNLVADALPTGVFDLVHTRMVLMHIPASVA